MHLFVLKHVDWKKLIKRSKTDNKCLAETFNNMQMHYSTEVHSLNVYLPSQSANQMKGISQLTGCTREKNFLEKSVPKCNYITQRNGLWYFFLRNCKLVKILECRSLLNAYIKPTVSFLAVSLNTCRGANARRNLTWKVKQYWMPCWQYGKGLVYLKFVTGN